MCSNIFDQENALSFYRIEPFTNREAWKWLLSQASQSMRHGEIIVSIRSLAKIWHWHKSKVERFIKLLKNMSLIETTIKTGRTSITICNISALASCKANYNTKSETMIKTEPCRITTKPSSQDNYEAYSSLPEKQQFSRHCPACLRESETADRQDRDNFEFKKKKEKNQKKEKEEDLKEKTIPYGDIKKEKVEEKFATPLSSIKASDVIDFAASIAMDADTVEWELDKFKDYFESSHKKLPRNTVAAFRNWLRRSLEFKRPLRVRAFLEELNCIS